MLSSPAVLYCERGSIVTRMALSEDTAKCALSVGIMVDFFEMKPPGFVATSFMGATTITEVWMHEARLASDVSNVSMSSERLIFAPFERNSVSLTEAMLVTVSVPLEGLISRVWVVVGATPETVALARMDTVRVSRLRVSKVRLRSVKVRFLPVESTATMLPSMEMAWKTASAGMPPGYTLAVQPYGFTAWATSETKRRPIMGPGNVENHWSPKSSIVTLTPARTCDSFTLVGYTRNVGAVFFTRSVYTPVLLRGMPDENHEPRATLMSHVTSCDAERRAKRGSIVVLQRSDELPLGPVCSLPTATPTTAQLEILRTLVATAELANDWGSTVDVVEAVKDESSEANVDTVVVVK
eukprot:PhM_4_TR1246/c1_g1_i1/m.28358